MFYADTVGTANVYESVQRFHQAHGEFWKPAGLLERLAREGGKFNNA